MLTKQIKIFVNLPMLKMLSAKCIKIVIVFLGKIIFFKIKRYCNNLAPSFWGNELNERTNAFQRLPLGIIKTQIIMKKYSTKFL